MSALGNYCQIRETLRVMAGWSCYCLPAKNKGGTILNISPKNVMVIGALFGKLTLAKDATLAHHKLPI